MLSTDDPGPHAVVLDLDEVSRVLEALQGARADDTLGVPADALDDFQVPSA